MARKTEMSDFEYFMAFQQAELRYEKKKLADKARELYEGEVNLVYIQREYELSRHYK